MDSFELRVDGRALRDAEEKRRREHGRKAAAPPVRRPPDPLSAGRWLLALTLAATAMYLFAGYMSFELLTNPTILNAASTLETPAPAMEDQSIYIYLSAVAGVLNMVFLLVAAIKGNAGSLPLVAVIGTQFGFLGYGILVPFLREVVLFAPPAIVLVSISRIIGPQSPYLQKLHIVGYLTLLPAIMLDLFMLEGKAFGAVILYVSTLLLGLSTLALGLRAREHHYRKMEQEARLSQPSVPPYPVQVPFETLSSRSEAPATPPSPPRRMNPMVTLCVAGALLLILFMPPLQELGSGPKLEIYWNQRSGDSSQSNPQATLEVEAWVINRGAGAASGAIRLEVQNDTRRFDIGSTDSISGFGSWHVKTQIGLPNTRTARRNVTIHLYIDDRPVDVRLMRTPGFEAVVPLAVAVLVKALVEHRRKRDD